MRTEIEKIKIPLHLATDFMRISFFDFLDKSIYSEVFFIVNPIFITLHMKSTPTPLVAVTFVGGLWRTWPMPWML